jgi:hypothetical protein
MAIPDLVDTLAKVEEVCDRRRSADDERSRISVTVDDNAIVVAEEHAPWSGDPDAEWTRTPVAQLRWTATRQEWSLQEPTLEGGWTRYRGPRAPTRAIDPQLDELDRDPTAIFWG